MSQCCSQTGETGSDKKSAPKKLACPVNQHEYVSVPLKTILHHVKKSWNINLTNQLYYYCNDPDCEIVYFSENDAVIKKSQLRTKFYDKTDNNSLICHCFGVSIADLKANPEIKNFVIQQTKTGNCSCETSNPSGRCCLKDFI